MKVLVIGGAGFIGRSVVAALIVRGADVTVGTRRPRRDGCPTKSIPIELHRPTQDCSSESVRPERSEGFTTHQTLRYAQGERVSPFGEQYCRLALTEDWVPLIETFDVVVNCAGILRERWGESFEAVYRDAPIAIANACAALGKRFIHVTALGLSDAASSGFITAKLAGEQGMAKVPGEMCIVRPSLLDGVDGFGSRWLRRVAEWPVHFVPADAAGRLAPLQVEDLGEAIAALCTCPREALPASVELGGEVHYSLAQYLRALRVRRRDAIRLPVPGWLVRVFAHVFDLLHLTPLSWGHVELLRRDNVPRSADAFALRQWIGRAPLAAGDPAMAFNYTGRVAPTPTGLRLKATSRPSD